MSVRLSMTVSFFVLGLISLTGQVLVLFHGTEPALGIFFGSWLASIGIGATVGAVYSRAKSRSLPTLFSWGMVVLLISILAEILVLRSVPGLFGVEPAEAAPMRGIAVAVPVGTLVTAFLTGGDRSMWKKCGGNWIRASCPGRRRCFASV